MRINIKFLCACFPLFLILSSLNSLKAQKLTPGEQVEKKFIYWSISMEQVRAQVGATQQEYAVFNRFYKHSIDSVHTKFVGKVNDATVDVNSIRVYVQNVKPFFINLFNNFRKIEQEFPTSVDEYRNPPKFRPGGDSCFSSCYNTNFGDGTLNGWYGYYAVNSSPDDNVGPFNITSITGGYCGPVTNAGGLDPNTGNDYQIRITSGATQDPFLQTYSTYSMSEVSPWASGGHSVMLGDSNRNGQGTAILSQSFQVSPTTSSLTYQYAVLLENPVGHFYYAQPFFSVAILDQNGDTIPTCGEYQVNALNAQANHFHGVWYPIEGDSVYWKDWTIVNVPLKKYVGQCVTIVFQVQDCSLGGHFGYAYVDASCSPLQLIASSPNFCGQDSISLTAPPGATSYKWAGPIGKHYKGIRGSDSGQIAYVDSPGVYSVITVPVTGAFCADTIFDTIGKLPGPFPHPAFTADSVCVGQAMRFINKSHPDSGSFSWDFYDIGIYNYNDIKYKDTTWTYASAGTYTVKLHQLANGCGLDTVIKVTTFNPPVATITPLRDTICAGQTAVLKGFGTGVYSWSTGSSDTVISVAPTKTTRYRLKISVNNSGCSDTTSALVVVRAALKTSISHDTSICPNQPVTIVASESGEPPRYFWSTGATTSSIHVAPAVTTTYTAIISGKYCYHDTLTNTVTVVPPPVATISGQDWKCKGVKDTLYVSSNTNPTTYIWDNGKTTTSITTGAINADSVITVTATNSIGCTSQTSYTITLRQPPIATINPIIEFCAGQPITLVAMGNGTNAPFEYTWSTGQTGSSITINPGPDSTTSYSVKVSNGCIGTATTSATPNVPYIVACCSQTLIINNDTTILVAGGNSKKYQWQEQPNLGTITCLDPPRCDSVRVTTSVATTYTVIGTDSLGCQAEQVLSINIDVPCFDPRIPNVITPSNPGPLGLNGLFYIRTENIDAWAIHIYDRWGKEVFASTNPYLYWNGNTEGGSKAADGVYYYVIDATCQNATYKKDGFIQLIR